MDSRTDSDADYRHELTDEQHRDLAKALSQVQGKVILSGYPSALYDELYESWYRVQRMALADGARKRTEVLWMNYEPPEITRTEQGELL